MSLNTYNFAVQRGLVPSAHARLFVIKMVKKLEALMLYTNRVLAKRQATT